MFCTEWPAVDSCSGRRHKTVLVYKFHLIYFNLHGCGVVGGEKMFNLFQKNIFIKFSLSEKGEKKSSTEEKSQKKGEKSCQKVKEKINRFIVQARGEKIFSNWEKS